MQQSKCCALPLGDGPIVNLIKDISCGGFCQILVFYFAHNTDCSVLRTPAFLRKFAPAHICALCSFTLRHQKRKRSHAGMALFSLPMPIMHKKDRHLSVCFIYLICGWVEGFEPSTFRTTIWRANQLCYTHHRLLPYEPEGIRTPDPALRRRMLYPAELLIHTIMNIAVTQCFIILNNPHRFVNSKLQIQKFFSFIFFPSFAVRFNT